MSFLAQRTVLRNYSAGQSVFGEGEPCAGLYVVEAGHVRIFKSSANGREQVLSIDGPGSSIAELPVFDGGNYPASVTAIDDATLLFVSKQDFHALCLAHPQVALKVLRVVGSRLRRLVGIIEELSFTISWDELSQRTFRPDGVTIRNVFDRLKRVDDPWKDFWRNAVSLKKVFGKMEELDAA